MKPRIGAESGRMHVGAGDEKPRANLPQAFKYALSGIWATIKRERNIKIELVFAAAAIITAIALRLSWAGWAIIIVLIAVVLAAELFNSAIEALVDRVSPEEHPLAKHAKDAAAGAVLVLSIAAAIAGLIVYIDAFLKLGD
jgi:diacylglycerol kinase